MRKVTEQTVSAFLAGRKRSVGNTWTEGTYLFLHGNVIARKDEDGNVTLSDCGWRTVTTKERLNGVLALSGSPWRIFQRDFEWSFCHIGDWREREWDHNTMQRIPEPDEV